MIDKRAVIGFTAFALASILVTGLIWNTLQNNAGGPTTTYRAAFHDVSGLQVNDHVRIAGVRIGKVTSIDLDGRTALVTFTVAKDEAVFNDTTVAVRYQNLIGQRFLSLERPPADVNETSGPRQDPATTIPATRTEDSLDLSQLLNGFQPIFQVLEPKDVNRLADSLIRAFDGQGTAIDSSLNEIATLSATFGNRDAVLAEIISNLTPVISDLARSGESYRQLLDQSQRLVTGLAEQRDTVGGAVSGVSELLQAVTGLAKQAEAPIGKAVRAADRASSLFAANRSLLDSIIQRFPGFIEGLGRTAEHGSWIDLYPCHLDGSAPFLLVPDGTISNLGEHHHSEVCSK